MTVKQSDVNQSVPYVNVCWIRSAPDPNRTAMAALVEQKSHSMELSAERTRLLFRSLWQLSGCVAADTSITYPTYDQVRFVNLANFTQASAVRKYRTIRNSINKNLRACWLRLLLNATACHDQNIVSGSRRNKI